MHLQEYFKGVFFLTLFPLFIGLRAQTLSVSSYSRYGLGEKFVDNDVSIKSMGGISTAYEAPLGSGVNFSNPATNTKIGATVFSLEGTSCWMRHSENNTAHLRNTFFFSKISLGFPLNKRWFTAFAYEPYSGYFAPFEKNTIPSVKQDPSIHDIKWSGGLNTLQSLINYAVNDNFQLGISGSYLFGTLERSYQQTLSQDAFNTLEINHKINALEIKLGALYSKISEQGKRWTIGANYGIGALSGLKKIDTQQKIKIIEKDNPGIKEDGKQEKIKELVFDGDPYATSKHIPFSLPASFSLGIAYGKDFNWMLSGQFNWSKNNELNSLALSEKTEQEQWKNAQRFSLGGYWIPRYNSYKNYFSKVIYRAGVYYENTGLLLSDRSIYDRGVNLGAGFPLKIQEDEKVLSYFNIGIGLGQRGSNQRGLIKETYTNLQIGFTFGSKWFERRIYN